MKLVPCCLAIALFVLSAAAQTTSPVDFHSAQDIQATLASLIPTSQASGYASDKLFDAGTHSLALSVRTKSGGGEAHAHYDDIMIVVDGAATEITGGAVVDAQAGVLHRRAGPDLDAAFHAGHQDVAICPRHRDRERPSR